MKISRTRQLKLLGVAVAGAMALTAPLVHAQIYYEAPVTLAPPELPQYDQAPMPGDGYLWTPGFWAWNPDQQGFYWVQGTWVQPPQIGYLWTPGYWTETDDGYEYVEGYWAQDVGFYGGINYGNGYGGVGYEGAYWRNGSLFYNRLVTNFGVIVIERIYEAPTSVYSNSGRLAFNGRHGIAARPGAYDMAAAREQHYSATADQPVHTQRLRANTVNPNAYEAAPRGPQASAYTPPSSGAVYAREDSRVNAPPAVGAGPTGQMTYHPDNNQSTNNAQAPERAQRMGIENRSATPGSIQQTGASPVRSVATPIVRPQVQAASPAAARPAVPVARPPAPPEPLKKTN